MKIRSVGAQLLHEDGLTDTLDNDYNSPFAMLQTRLKMYLETHCSIFLRKMAMSYRMLYFRSRSNYGLSICTVSVEMPNKLKLKQFTPVERQDYNFRFSYHSLPKPFKA